MLEQETQDNALLQELYREDFQRVDALIASTLALEGTPLIQNLAGHILSLRGKRIRPLLAIMSAQICGYSGSHHHTLAASLELMHTATLLHDDVVDESQKRRGKDCAHKVWGNRAAILVGDFLLSRSFQMIVGVNNRHILESFSRAASIIAQGEISQLEFSFDPHLSLAQYLKIISYKTGSLLAVACETGPLLTQQAPEIVQLFGEFGRNLGCVFQMKDDLLDYNPSQDRWGKNHGDDFLEGKVTLPFIIAYQTADERQKQVLTRALEHPTAETFQEVICILNATNSFHIAREHISYLSEQAVYLVDRLSHFFPQAHQLQKLVDFCTHRTY